MLPSRDCFNKLLCFQSRLLPTTPWLETSASKIPGLSIMWRSPQRPNSNMKGPKQCLENRSEKQQEEPTEMQAGFRDQSPCITSHLPGWSETGLFGTFQNMAKPSRKVLGRLICLSLNVMTRMISTLARMASEERHLAVNGRRHGRIKIAIL